RLWAGYSGGRKPFTAAGCLETGAFGRLEEDGCLHVLGRRTDLIVTGGENVYPAEVEAALVEIPGITAACVFGIPDETWGQIVGAALVGRRDVDLRAHLEARLAGFKRPRRIVWLDALPLLPNGKVDRSAVLRHAACSVLLPEVTMPNDPKDKSKGDVDTGKSAQPGQQGQPGQDP